MTEYTVTLTTTDGRTAQIDCAPGEDVITAAERAHIFLNAQCRAGTCGACLATAHGDAFSLGGYAEDALPTSLRAEGKVLMCRTHPTGNLGLALPYPYDQVRFEPPPRYMATITDLTLLTLDTVKLDLQLAADGDGNAALMFEPGQFVRLALPGTGIARPYSLANAPGWDGRLEFLIKLRDGGAFSSWLRDQAAPGDPLTVDGPYGTFTLQDRGLRPRYFIAGGCGLASVLSMLRQMAAFQEPHRCHLFFGVWYADEVFFEAELAELKRASGTLTVTTCVTEPSADWGGFSGSVVDALEQALREEVEAPDLYVCGSPHLVQAVMDVAGRRGLAPEQVIFERYLAGVGVKTVSES